MVTCILSSLQLACCRHLFLLANHVIQKEYLVVGACLRIRCSLQWAFRVCFFQRSCVEHNNMTGVWQSRTTSSLFVRWNKSWLTRCFCRCARQHARASFIVIIRTFLHKGDGSCLNNWHHLLQSYSLSFTKTNTAAVCLWSLSSTNLRLPNIWQHFPYCSIWMKSPINLLNK